MTHASTTQKPSALNPDGRNLFIRNATVLTMDDVHGATPITRSIRVRGGQITEIGTDLVIGPDETLIEGRDRLVTPGYVNAHTHSWEALYRARLDNLPLEHWMLLSYPVLGLEPISPDLIRLRSQLVALESLRNGVTTLVDDVLEIPGQSEGQLAAVFDAYDEIGIRANISGHVMDVPFIDHFPFLRDTLEPELRRELDALAVTGTDDYLAFARAAATRYADFGDGRLRFMVGPSAPQRCTPEMLVGTSELAREFDLEFHIHVLETRTQAVTAEERFGKTMVGHLQSLGVLDEHVTMAHGIWLTDDDLDVIAGAGASVSHNPISNLKLGSGIAPWRKYMDKGITVGLGTDGMSSSDTARMSEVVKTAALLHKVTGPDHRRWPTAQEVLTAGTLGGARSARLGDTVGSIEVGKRADLVFYDMTTLSFTPRNRPEYHLVYSENGSSIRTVVVDGRIVLDDGVITTVDEQAVLAELQERGPQIRAWQDELETRNRALLPAFERQYATTMARDTAVDRYSGRGECWVN
ncbi:amidohydrolase [Gordonia sp. NB41Y]|uniref:amidohydrolase family protein n=1 Tax=Gordonia sp. NB41Y TaxID=875808 RepID=UPI0002BEA957|nr:amidohydrolase [Gordonia sp. NB41Y]EMP12204.1 amidohydrolase [Gordonia sp. NB41Y]WLP92896.1 amidohydrolase [Gordonia sp. NB41Y]